MPRVGAIERFEDWHEKVFGPKPSRPAIPHWVMRDYLDTLNEARRNRPGLHNVTITVTRVPAMGLLNWDTMLSEGIEIRVEGQKWPR